MSVVLILILILAGICLRMTMILPSLATITVLAVCVFAGLPAKAETTSTLSDAETQGRALAEKILAQKPAQNYTNTGVLEIRGQKGRVKIPVEFTVLAGEPWLAFYSTRMTNGGMVFQRDHFSALTIVHEDGRPNVYRVPNINRAPNDTNDFLWLTGEQVFQAFAASDFSCGDLGLEFFHWPGQKVIKKEFHRQCPCAVLESTNPHPSPDAYSRVVCWIDNGSLGVVEAYAYDATGKRLKNFYPKNLQKVNGQYQVESMVMENLQTGSRSILEFDLDK